MRKKNKTKEEMPIVEEIVAEVTEESGETETIEEAEEVETVEATEEAEEADTAEATEEADTVEATEEAEAAEAVEEAETTEESATEDELATKPGMKLWKKVMIIVGILLVVLAAVYFGVAKYYSDRFLMSTTVNGMDCAGKTVADVEAMMQTQVEEYVLVLEEANGTTEEIKGIDIGIHYNGIDVIQEAFAAQNSYTWFTNLYEKNNIEAVVDFEYDSAKLDEVISQLNCLKEENQVAPVTAKPVFTDGTYEIQEEVYGTQMNQEQLYAVIHSAVDAMETTVNLEDKECYVLPAFTKDSEEVIAARDALNKCISANITYSLDSITEMVDLDTIVPWLSVDESMNVIVDEAQVRAFTDTLGAKYNTPNSAAELTTPTGKVVSFSNARKGRVVGSEAECSRLIEEIKAGKTITREPILSQQATPEGQTIWGETYVEVDISAQHMWYVVDGQPVFETDIITGLRGQMDTPSGIFQILEKLSPKTLRGNIVPETGQPEYITPVKYWARVTWSGIGFHDCTWHQTFGGDIYMRAGSHGCINMPPDAAAEFYGMVYVGCPVLIHY